MTKSEYLKNVIGISINSDRVDTIQAIYGVKLNETVSKAISFAGKVDFFAEERRALSFSEICAPQKLLDYDFTDIQLIPIIDAYDNAFIVYVPNENKWARYHIFDEVVYRKRNALEEVL